MTRRNLSLLTVAALFSLIQTGCDRENPAAVPRNSQPVVADISATTLEDGDSTTVNVRIEDEDQGDLHTINATCEDQGVAQSSIEDQTITIGARGVGETTCTVYATDSSGLGDAQSAPVTFQVTVTEPPVDLGACQVGMRVRPGESCNYPAGQYQVRFSVKPDGSSCRKSDKPITKEVFGGEVTIRGLGDFCVYYDIRGDDVFDTTFSAEKNSDDSWTVDDVPCQIPPLDKDYNGVPATFVFQGDYINAVLLSDGDFVAFASRSRESPVSWVMGGPVQTSTRATVEFVGGDFLNRDGAGIPDGELTEFEVSDTFKGELELRGDLMAMRLNVPVQDGTTIRGSNRLEDVYVESAGPATCIPVSEDPVAEVLTQLAEDLLDIMRDLR